MFNISVISLKERACARDYLIYARGATVECATLEEDALSSPRRPEDLY